MVAPKRPYVPNAGDLVWLDFDPQLGREHKKRRPALVLTPLPYNRASGLAVVCPCTSVRKGYPFEVHAVIAGRDAAILSDQIKSLDWRRRHAEIIERADTIVVDRVRALVAALLQIPLR
jgi:mRNA interferase MazF